MPADLLVGKNVIMVHFAAVRIDLLAVDIGGTVAAFEVKADAREVGKLVGAPRTFDILAHMDGGFEVL